MFKSKNWNYFNPVRVEVGSIDSISKFVNGKKILIITSPGFTRRGVVDKIKNNLAPLTIIVWDTVKSNPDLEDLERASTALRSLNIDFVIALGGGSVIDTAKVLATSLSYSENHNLIQYFRENKLNKFSSRLPLLVIPSTSGTGSEVTPFATVWDHLNFKKYSLSGEFVYPDIALLDVSLTLTLSADDTLFPALDTISHSLESIWNINSNSLTRIYAYKSLSLSVYALPNLLNGKNDVKYRDALQFASFLAGLAISQTKTAIAHEISYIFTLKKNIPHGLACSFLLVDMIDDYLEQNPTINPDEIQALNNVRDLLVSLKLKDKIKKYTNIIDFLPNLNLIGKERLKNYNGNNTPKFYLTKDLKSLKINNELNYYYEEIDLYYGRKVICPEVSQDNLREFKKIFDKNDIMFALMFGTLLGAIREKKFIEYDEDVDVFIFDYDRVKLINSLLELRYVGFEVARIEGDLISFIRNNDYIDVYIFNSNGNNFKCNEMLLSKKYISELIEINFLGLNIRAPKNPESLLAHLYGKDWRVPIKNFHARPYSLLTKFKIFIYQIYSGMKKYIFEYLK